MKRKVFVGVPTWNAYPQSACVIKGILDLYDRNQIVLCVLDNGSTDPRMREWNEKHEKDYDIFIQNPYNNGPTLKDNQMIKAFMGTDCEWYIYTENDAIPCTPYPASTLLYLYEKLQNTLRDNWPRAIGFSMKYRAEYPLNLLRGNQMPTKEEFYASLGTGIYVNNEPKPDPVEQYPAIPSAISGKMFWDDGVRYISSSVCRAHPLFMSICIHREVWERLGYFDESDVHGDVEFYRRIKATGWDFGLTSSIGFYANDFVYNKERYMDKGRWLGVQLYNKRAEMHMKNLEQMARGNIYRGSVYDPPSLDRYNPVLLNNKNYETWAYDNLMWCRDNVQPDFSDGTPSWLEKTHPNYEAFKPILIGKLRFVGDDKTADAVEKGEL